MTTALGAAALGVYRLLPAPSPGPQAPRRTGELARRIGALVEESYRSRGLAVEDPRLQAAVQTLADRLAAATGREPAFRVLLVRSSQANALALPGGLIVLDTGLLESLGAADQMAAVMAHELGHVAYGDSMRQLVRRLGLSVLLTALGGGQAEALVRRILGQLVELHYSRRIESRADAFALRLLARAQLDPAALARALEAIRRASGGEARLPPYLGTHPALERRLKEARAAPGPARLRPLGVDWEAFQRRLRSVLTAPVLNAADRGEP